MSDAGQWVGKLTAIEEEVVVLNAVAELIDSIVNLEVLGSVSEDAKQIWFPTKMNRTHFNIMLVDLLSKTDKKGPIKGKAYLSCLASIVENPHFNDCGSVDNLAERTREFRDWLDKTFTTEDLWLPSIDKHVPLTMTRLDLIKISGNICRHNFLRAAGIAGDVRKIFAKSGTEITLEEALLVLSELNENWLHGHIFIYHSSTIVELLNNIRWGIYTYFHPQFRSRIFIENKWGMEIPRYSLPDNIKDSFAKEAYGRLMNSNNRSPIIPRFEVAENLKKLY